MRLRTLLFALGVEKNPVYTEQTTRFVLEGCLVLAQ